MKQLYTLTTTLAVILTFLGHQALAQNFGVDVSNPQEKLDVNGAIRIGNTANSNAGSVRYNTISQKFQVNISGTWYDLATTSSAQITNVDYNTTTNILTVTENGTNWTVDLTELQDNTDDQALSYNASSNVLTLEDGGTVDLTDLQDNTDNQNMNDVYEEAGNNVEMDATTGNVRFFKVGNEILFLQEADGNVGIGTNSPAQKLDVQGSVRMSAVSGGANGALVKADVNGDLSASGFPNDNDQVIDGTGNWVDINTMLNGDYIENQNTSDQVADFRITGNGIFNGGNVGIGTISPSYKLHVYDASSGRAVNVTETNSGDGVRITESGAGDGLYVTSADAGNAAVFEGGNVGIGTSSTSSTLNVYDVYESATQADFTQANTNAGVLITTKYNNGSFVPGVFWNSENNSPTKPKAGIYLQTTDPGSKMILATSTDYPTGITNNAVVIDQDANVGLGTLSPASRLDLADHDGDVRIYDANGTPHILGDETSGETDGIILKTTSNPAAGEPIFGVESSGGSQRLRVEHNGALKTSNYLEVDGTGESYLMGNTGIGTSNPSTRLHVQGDARVTGLGGSGTRLVQTDNNGNVSASSINPSNTPQGTGSTNYLARWTSSTALGTGTTYDNGTNVGIGTNSPSSKLHVDQTYSATLAEMSRFVHRRSDISDNDEGGYLAFKVIDGNNGGDSFDHARISWRNNGNGGDENEGQLGFWTASNGTTTEKMTIKNNGNVGIGVTGPTEKLQVNGNLRLAGNGYIDDDGTTGGNSDDWIRLRGYIELKSNTDNYGIVLRDKDNTEYFGLTQRNGSSYLTDNNTYSNYFIRGNGASAYVRGDLTVHGGDIYDNSGNLRLNGEDNVYISMDYNNNDGNNRAIMFGRNDEGGNGNWSELMRIQEAGNVGIGVSSPVQKLDVNGRLRIRGGSPSSGRVLMSSNGSGDATWVDIGSQGIGDNLGNHSATTNLNMNNRQIDNIDYLDMRASTGRGIRFWSSNSYKISMGNSSEYKYGAVNDYSIKMSMNNDGDRGWTWGVSGSTPIASIDTEGHMTLAGDLDVRGADIEIANKHAFRGNDSWLRLNQNNSFTSGTYSPQKIRADGGFQVDGNWVIESNAGWHRSYGNTGWRNATHGGGWYMSNSSWIRAYNNRSILGQVNNTTPAIRGDQTYSGQYAGEFRSYNSSNGAAIRAYGYVYAYTYYSYSTKTMKKDIQKFDRDDYESSLAFVGDLDLNYYRFKDDEEYPKIHVGLIAEDAPTTITAPGQKGISANELTIFNTGAIKALNNKMQEQESQISDFGADNVYAGDMWVEFSDKFKKQLNGADPIVVLTPSQTGTVLNLAEINQDGFRVENPNDASVTFSWIAMANVTKPAARSKEKMYSENFSKMIKSAENDTRPVPIDTPDPGQGNPDPGDKDTHQSDEPVRH